MEHIKSFKIFEAKIDKKKIVTRKLQSHFLNKYNNKFKDKIANIINIYLQSEENLKNAYLKVDYDNILKTIDDQILKSIENLQMYKDLYR